MVKPLGIGLWIPILKVLVLSPAFSFRSSYIIDATVPDEGLLETRYSISNIAINI